jgi:hypothetical protein
VHYHLDEAGMADKCEKNIVIKYKNPAYTIAKIMYWTTPRRLADQQKSKIIFGK